MTDYPYADVSLSRRLERAEGRSNAAFVESRARLAPDVGATWIECAGAFALFDPGQQTRLFEAITSREGRVLIAGEHASLHHAWIQGAIESGLRAAREVHAAS